MMESFRGFGRGALTFLRQLKRNNKREWFQANRETFDNEVLVPLKLLVEELDVRFASFAPEFVGDPKRSIFRIYRDVRFSKDKSPYKTHMGASFPWVDGADGATDVSHTDHANGAYFHLQPGENFAGGGMWHASKPVLDAFRKQIVDDEAGVRAALEDPAFIAEFGPVNSHESLKRVPPGYPPDHPMADLLRYKDVVFGRRLSDAEIYSPDLPAILADAYAKATPVFTFLSSLAR
jgi:uncharacterized protein (TIGR02453 family)